LSGRSSCGSNARSWARIQAVSAAEDAEPITLAREEHEYAEVTHAEQLAGEIFA